MRAVLIESFEQLFQRQFIHLRRAQEQLERGQQIHRAQRNFHRAIPIHAARNRILSPPARQLLEKLATVF